MHPGGIPGLARRLSLRLGGGCRIQLAGLDIHQLAVAVDPKHRIRRIIHPGGAGGGADAKIGHIPVAAICSILHRHIHIEKAVVSIIENCHIAAGVAILFRHAGQGGVVVRLLPVPAVILFGIELGTDHRIGVIGLPLGDVQRAPFFHRQAFQHHAVRPGGEPYIPAHIAVAESKLRHRIAVDGRLHLAEFHRHLQGMQPGSVIRFAGCLRLRGCGLVPGSNPAFIFGVQDGSGRMEQIPHRTGIRQIIPRLAAEAECRQPGRRIIGRSGILHGQLKIPVHIGVIHQLSIRLVGQLATHGIALLIQLPMLREMRRLRFLCARHRGCIIRRELGEALELLGAQSAERDPGSARTDEQRTLLIFLRITGIHAIAVDSDGIGLFHHPQGDLRRRGIPRIASGGSLRQLAGALGGQQRTAHRIVDRAVLIQSKGTSALRQAPVFPIRAAEADKSPGLPLCGTRHLHPGLKILIQTCGGKQRRHTGVAVGCLCRVLCRPLQPGAVLLQLPIVGQFHRLQLVIIRRIVGIVGGERIRLHRGLDFLDLGNAELHRQRVGGKIDVAALVIRIAAAGQLIAVDPDLEADSVYPQPQRMYPLGIPGAAALFHLIGHGGSGIPILILGVEQQTAGVDDKGGIAFVFRIHPAAPYGGAETEECHPIVVPLRGGIFYSHIKALVGAGVIVQNRHGFVHILAPGAAAVVAPGAPVGIYRPPGGEILLGERCRAVRRSLHAVRVVSGERLRRGLVGRIGDPAAHRHCGDQQHRRRDPTSPAPESSPILGSFHTVPSPSCIF